MLVIDDGVVNVKRETLVKRAVYIDTVETSYNSYCINFLICDDCNYSYVYL